MNGKHDLHVTDKKVRLYFISVHVCTCITVFKNFQEDAG